MRLFYRMEMQNKNDFAPFVSLIKYLIPHSLCSVNPLNPLFKGGLGDYNVGSMELGKTPHTVNKIRYHLVTAVKYRKALLKPEVEECIRETMKGINERYNIIIDELGFDGDHIHIFCGAKPQSKSGIAIDKVDNSKTDIQSLPKFRKEELWGEEFLE